MQDLLLDFNVELYITISTILRSLPEAYQETAQSILLFGPFGINALRPESLFGFESFAPLTHGVIWSLGLNIVLYLISKFIDQASLSKFRQKASFIMKQSLYHHRTHLLI